MAKGKTKNRADLEWENRVLCSDESCIGVIGPDKRCKECGREYEGELPWSDDDSALGDDHDDHNDHEAPSEADSEDDTYELETDDAPEAGDADSITDDEWASRILCSDESCIGVVGPDGKCKDCGKPYEK
jgi:hypothetical protein